MEDKFWWIFYVVGLPFIAVTAYYNKLVLAIYATILMGTAVVLTIFGK